MTIRPDDIEIVKELGAENGISGKVLVRTFLGKSYQYEVESNFGRLVVNGSDMEVYETGDSIYLNLPSHKIVLV